jgi:formate dehydrogenase (coenzyme F420) beta subunit
MIEQVRAYVKGLFDEGKINAFIGLQDLEGAVAPHLFHGPGDLDDGFTTGDDSAAGAARYPMASIAMTVSNAHPDKILGVLVRGCDERALNEIVRWNQINESERKVVKVGIACPKELAEAHECRKPFPDTIVAGEKADPAPNATVARIMEMDLPGRLHYWLKEFDRCVKCYGCRNVCPVCFCNVCTLEDDVLIRTGDLPPENPMFHLTRAVHMAGRCIDCNLCTEACPADIPLRTLYKKVAEIVRDEFGYTTGEQGPDKSPLNILGPPPGHTSAND